jgi:amidophosphoribosyltransferase
MKIEKDKPKCHCGVFGIYGTDSAAVQTYYGLHALQHRGQEASGIITKDTNMNGSPVFHVHKNVGLVSEVYSDHKIFKETLIGSSAIGHNRYSTTGSDSIKNIQPFMVHYRLGNIGVSHNGNLTNAKELREELVNEGAIFQTTSDTEVILHLIARSKLADQIEQIKEALNMVKGAYCLTILTDNKLIAARDPYGFRPLAIGRLKNGAYVIASETCAFDIISAEFVREVEPGEIVIIDDEVILTGKLKSVRICEKENTFKHCIFEYIYFSRPDSFIFGHNVDKMRRRLGKVLARKHPVVDKDDEKVIVISVPDSSNTTAIGYQSELEKMGISSKLEIGLIRSHYIGRTFIKPGQENREMGVKFKFNIVKGVLEGRTVVIIDDSIVRGTTSKQLVNLIKEANPKEIHLRISSSPIMFPCYYGMDFPSKQELIAYRANGNIKEIGNQLGVDSLEYLTIDEMLEAVSEADSENFCTACFSGIYPTKVDHSFKKEIYEV